MKKNLLIALAAGLMTVLAGCVVVVTGSRLSNFTYASSWIRSDTSQPVICDNRSTTIEYSFTYTGDLSAWTEQWTGRNDPTFNFTVTRTSGDSGVFVDINSKTVTVSRTFTPGTSPFGSSGVSPQAITPVPITPPPSERGGATLTVLYKGNVQSQKSFPVYGNCP